MPTTPGAERLELRITPELRSLLSSAAAARGQTLNDFFKSATFQVPAFPSPAATFEMAG